MSFHDRESDPLIRHRIENLLEGYTDPDHQPEPFRFVAGQLGDNLFKVLLAYFLISLDILIDDAVIGIVLAD